MKNITDRQKKKKKDLQHMSTLRQETQCLTLNLSSNYIYLIAVVFTVWAHIFLLVCLHNGQRPSSVPIPYSQYVPKEAETSEKERVGQGVC